VRSIIKKILLESIEPNKIEVGDIFSTTERGTENKPLIMVTDIIQDGKPRIRSVQTRWGTKEYESEGYSLNYKVSLDNGETWVYEDGEGHYVDTGWIGELIKMGHWSLEQKNVELDSDFFDSLTESEEEFDWLPTQNEIGLKVRVDGKPFYVEDYYHLQDEGMFTSKVGGWNDCYEIIDEKVFNNIDCYIVKFNDHYPKVYFRKQDFVEKDFCNPQMNESEDEFGWATDIVKEEPIKLGDVFYIVDSNFGGDQHPMNHRPEDVRYLFFVTDIYEENGGLMIEYKNCDRKGISYNPKDYNPTNPRCHYDDGDGYYDYVKYDDALNLVDERYWRPMGNNGYYNHLNESETEKSECVGINLSNVTTEQKVSILKKLEEIYGTFVGFSQYPWVDQIQYLVTDFTTPVTMPLKGKRNQCGRWLNYVPENAYKKETDIYEVPISMDGTKVRWSKEIDGREFLNMSFIDDTSKLFESEEDDFGWAKDLVTEPFHHQLMKDNLEKRGGHPVDVKDVRYIMFNPAVEVGDKRFNKVAYFLEDNDYYPESLEPFGKKTSYIKITRFKDERQNGRWDIGPELSEQELYNFSQTKKDGYWAEEFIYVKF
jgi:hypothetical protein